MRSITASSFAICFPLAGVTGTSLPSLSDFLAGAGSYSLCTAFWTSQAPAKFSQESNQYRRQRRSASTSLGSFLVLRFGASLCLFPFGETQPRLCLLIHSLSS